MTTRALMNIVAAAEYLDTTVTHMRRLVYERRIPFVKLGDGPKAHLRFKVADLDAWIEQHTVVAEAS